MTNQQSKNAHPEAPASGCFAALAGRLESLVGGLNLLGLDAVLVGLCWQGAAAERFGVVLEWSERLLLGSMLWLAYIADRAADVRRYQIVTQGQLPPRHAFLRRHYGRFGVAFVIVASGTFAAAITTSSASQWIWGGVLAAMSLVYLAIAQLFPEIGRRWLPREVMVAAFFLAGTCLFPWLRIEVSTDTVLWGQHVGEWLVWVWLVLWSNAIGISVWERAQDVQLGEWTAMSQSGRWSQFYPLWLVMLLIAGVTRGTLSGGANELVAQQAALSATLLLMIDRMRATWVKPALADLAVLTPWVVR